MLVCSIFGGDLQILSSLTMCYAFVRVHLDTFLHTVCYYDCEYCSVLDDGKTMIPRDPEINFQSLNQLKSI